MQRRMVKMAVIAATPTITPRAPPTIDHHWLHRRGEISCVVCSKSVTISPSHSAFSSSYAHSNPNARVAYSNSSSNRSGRVGGGGANLVPNQHHNHHLSYPSSTTKRNQQIHHVHPHMNVSRNKNKKHRMNPIQTKNIIIFTSSNDQAHDHTLISVNRRPSIPPTPKSNAVVSSDCLN